MSAWYNRRTRTTKRPAAEHVKCLEERVVVDHLVVPEANDQVERLQRLLAAHAGIKYPLRRERALVYAFACNNT